MSTDIRPELSTKNKYWISKHRYYELKHFCLQYDEFKELHNKIIENCGPKAIQNDILADKSGFNDPVFETVVALDRCNNYIKMIEDSAKECGDLGKYILLGVTQGISCMALIMKHDMPACAETYYDRCRKFFYILNKKLWNSSY